jgi:hypothetical protein
MGLPDIACVYRTSPRSYRAIVDKLDRFENHLFAANLTQLEHLPASAPRSLEVAYEVIRALSQAYDQGPLRS